MQSSYHPNLSIIIPVYKVECMLSKCIDSILAQTYLDWEIILVDDGSPDGSGLICDSYAVLDSRIQVIHTSNGGQARARNIGIERIRGKYVTFVDSDDYLQDVCSFEIAIHEIEIDNRVDIVQFPFCGVGWDNGNEGMHCCNGTEILNGRKDALENFGVEGIDGDIYPAPWAKIYRSEIFKNMKFPEGIVFEDSFLLTDILQRIRFVKLIDKGCYAYVCNSAGTMAGSVTEKRHIDALYSHLHTLEACRQHGIDKVKFMSFFSVVFYDIYYAVIHFKKNLFPVHMLRSLETMCPKKLTFSHKIWILIAIARVMGFNRFFNLIAVLKK